MSILTGKCDLYDHISMQKHRTKDGSDKKEDLEQARVYYSDIMECFNVFKARTDGVIYQHKKVKVSEYNQDMVAELCPFFEIIEHKEIKEDKRKKSDKKETITYTYNYWGKEYTLKELNKKGVWISVPIKFNTLLELLPYFGYIVSSMCSYDGKETVYISSTNYAEEHQNEALEYGGEYALDIVSQYNQQLASLYQDVVNKYFCPFGRDRYDTVNFDENGIGYVSSPIDPNFKIAWMIQKPHWTSPKILDADKGMIQMSKEDLTTYLGNICDVFYVEKGEDVLYL